MSAHKSPEQVRSQLKHPVVDGDGHWLEYAPVFSEKMRKAAGDKSAEGFLAALRSTTDALKMAPEDRLTPAAIIPMHHPEEAIAELEFVTRQLGSKVGMFGSGMSRPVPAAAANDPESQRFAVSYDVLAIDSQYDYDPVWQKCVELGIAPTFHSSASGQGLRNSPSNFVYNHICHFAAAGHAVLNAILLSGAARHFQKLR